LALTPWLNHSWHLPLHGTARGLGTPPIPWGTALIEIGFDFVAHEPNFLTSCGGEESIALVPKSVAAFYRELFDALAAIRVHVAIGPTPNELDDAMPFATDEIHRAYDADAAHRFLRALIAAHALFTRFRSGFLGKASPVHFFWGSFGLAVARFAGRSASPHPGDAPQSARRGRARLL